ncbi:MAG: hypothetical protein EPN86_05345 [Nanoarchaeota archaeon]|nr:MAG: hypothetical protein EPN86_05345 [Nanoarchaeota archaeon]
MVDAKTNIKFGWLWIFLGFVLGLVLGLFAFNGPLQVPAQFMDYTSLPRRLLRLSHISFIGLGFLNWMYGVSLMTMKLKPNNKISKLLIFGTVTMSLFLIFAAFYEPIKYLLVVPAVSLTLVAFLFLKQIVKN